ncbi:FecR family protein [Mucilaginibacter pedocola]|uniref:FecR family protein n=1 Tax=Mucilaginibacter pedocola TaxID=1792845 RepID=UPI0009919FEB|nr:FecR domain-containing protein [Mucilaginibacter pedocola]
MEPTEFKALLEKYTSGQATAEEDELVKRLLDSYESTAGEPDMTDTERDELRERMLSNLMAYAEPPQRKVFRLNYKWAAAAILLVFIGLTAIFYKQPGKPQTPTIATTSAQKKLHAGGNKASLTLADGSVVVLDSAGNGLVALQGNTRITKTGDGQLQYAGGDANATALAYNTVATPNGGTYQLTLPDGTKVWLNAASSITFPTRFDNTSRNVKLTGEAYFEVAKKTTATGRLPFIVNAGASKVEVLGTHFNVSAYADNGSHEVTLLEGAVKVSRGGRSARIVPGQQATMAGGNAGILVGKANIENVMAWKDGLFSFDNTDISSAMKDIARWYNAKVVYKGSIPATGFTGVLPRSSDIQTVLDWLSSTRVLKCRADGETIIIEKAN